MSARGDHAMDATLEKKVERFRALPRELRLQALLGQAKRFPELPVELREARDRGLGRVEECQTPLYLWVGVEDGRVRIHADAPREAPTVRGFVGFLVEALDGGDPASIVDLPDDLMDRMGLSESARRAAHAGSGLGHPPHSTRRGPGGRRRDDGLTGRTASAGGRQRGPYVGRNAVGPSIGADEDRSHARSGRHDVGRVRGTGDLLEDDGAPRQLDHTRTYDRLVPEPRFPQVVHGELCHVYAPSACLDLGCREPARLERVEAGLLEPVEVDRVVEVREAVELVAAHAEAAFAEMRCGVHVVKLPR